MVRLSQTLGNLKSACTIQRHIEGLAETNFGNGTLNQSNAVLYLHASSDISGASGRINRETNIRFSAGFDPVEEAKGLNQVQYPGYNPVSQEEAVIDSIDDISIRNLRTNGKTKLISTVSPTDRINRTEVSISPTTVDFKNISGVNPVDPSNVLNNGSYTNVSNAVDGVDVTGVKTLSTKNKLDTVQFGLVHNIVNSSSVLQITKKIGNSSTTIVGVFI
jgi:hypothetical protein